MDEASLLALHQKLKSGAPRGKTGGMGLGVQRARRAVSSDLPQNALYKNFVREGAVLTEEEWLGGPRFEGKRQTFGGEEEAAAAAAAADEAEGEAGGGAGAAAAGAASGAAAGGAFSLKQMKALVLSSLAGSKQRRGKRKWLRSAAVEEATGGDGADAEEAAAAELFDKAVRKLVKKGRVAEIDEGGVALLALVEEGREEEEAVAEAAAAAAVPEARGAKHAKRAKRAH
jgi:hypothetical protein